MQHKLFSFSLTPISVFNLHYFRFYSIIVSVTEFALKTAREHPYLHVGIHSFQFALVNINAHPSRLLYYCKTSLIPVTATSI